MKSKTHTSGKIIKLARKHGISLESVRERIEAGWPEEILFIDPIECCDADQVSSDYEAYGECTPEQLEILREFDQIGKIAKC